MRGPLTAAGRRVAPLVVSIDAEGTLLSCMNGIDGVWAVIPRTVVFLELGVEGPAELHAANPSPWSMLAPQFPCADRSGELTRSERAKFFANSWRVRDAAIEVIARLRPP